MTVSEAKWIKNCQICNDGLCIRFEELKGDGHSDRRVAEIIEEEACQAHPELKDEFTAEVIRNRYRYHMKGQMGGNHPQKSKAHVNQIKVEKNLETTKGLESKSKKYKKPPGLDKRIEDNISVTTSLNYSLIKVKGFLGDIQSKQLQLTLKAEIERLQSTISQILSEYMENGF